MKNSLSRASTVSAASWAAPWPSLSLTGTGGAVYREPRIRPDCLGTYVYHACIVGFVPLIRKRSSRQANDDSTIKPDLGSNPWNQPCPTCRQTGDSNNGKQLLPRQILRF